MATENYNRLLSIYYDINLLESSSYLLTWDNETNVPERGSAHRGEQLSLLAGMIHEKSSSEELGNLLATVEEEYTKHDPYCDERVNLREWRSEYDRLTKLPNDLVREIKKATVDGRKFWLKARESNDFSLFAPSLQRIFDLKRREAEYYGYVTEPYEALFAIYEPGIQLPYIETVLSQLRDDLKQLVRDIQGSSVAAEIKNLDEHIPASVQETFVRKITAQIGFDYESGRLDIAPHPFCMQIGPGDTRLRRGLMRIISPLHFSVPCMKLDMVCMSRIFQRMPGVHHLEAMYRWVSMSLSHASGRIWSAGVKASGTIGCQFLSRI